MQTRIAVRPAAEHAAIINSFSTSEELGSVRTDFQTGTANPIAEIVSDEVYSLLRQNDLLNEKSLRDYIIRQMFLKLKADTRMRTSEAISALRDMYPYLQFDTIRKIVYRVYPSSSRKSMI